MVLRRNDWAGGGRGELGLVGLGQSETRAVRLDHVPRAQARQLGVRALPVCTPSHDLSALLWKCFHTLSPSSLSCLCLLRPSPCQCSAHYAPSPRMRFLRASELVLPQLPAGKLGALQRMGGSHTQKEGEVRGNRGERWGRGLWLEGGGGLHASFLLPPRA